MTSRQAATTPLTLTGFPCANGETIEWVLAVGEPELRSGVASLFANGDPTDPNYVDKDEVVRRLLRGIVRTGMR